MVGGGVEGPRGGQRCKGYAPYVRDHPRASGVGGIERSRLLPLHPVTFVLSGLARLV